MIPGSFKKWKQRLAEEKMKTRIGMSFLQATISFHLFIYLFNFLHILLHILLKKAEVKIEYFSFNLFNSVLLFFYLINILLEA